MQGSPSSDGPSRRKAGQKEEHSAQCHSSTIIVKSREMRRKRRGQHPIVPEQSLVSEITHVALAFMRSSDFNVRHASSDWPLFTTVSEVRQKFKEGTTVMVAIGGWGDTEGFSEAAGSEDGRKLFASNVKAMVESTGADGVDIDWEYPGGNGEDYKKVKNAEKAWEIEAYPKLLSEIRAALGPEKVMSAAVPGLTRDMMAFSRDTIPSISASLDFFNIMTYDLMNRRDNMTKHHTGLQLSLQSVDAYLERGVEPDKANLGFAFYVKCFRTDAAAGCDRNPIGCATPLMEDPDTGADLGQTGGFSWHDNVPSDLSRSFDKALRDGQYDEEGGGHYYWDAQENRWWTWDTPRAISEKFPAIMETRGLGGVFAWGLGEDAEHWTHLKALTACWKDYSARDAGRISPSSSIISSEAVSSDEPPRGREEL